MRARAALAVLGVGALLAAVPARAEAPAAQGWWTSLHRTGAPAPPAPPDVAADDLLLQGGDPARALPDTGVVDRAPAPTALAALRFTVPPGADVGALVLQVGPGAQAADVRAYPTGSAWVPAQGGPAEAAPVPDRSRYSQGALSADGTTLAFADAGRLVTEDGVLSVVLVPGPLDRVVVHRPGPATLAVTAPEGCFCSPSLPPVAAPPVVVAPAPAPVGAAPVAVAPVAAVPEPPQPLVVSPPPALVPSRTQAAGRVVADDGRTRLLLGLEALLVLAFFGLLGQGPLARLALLTGQAAQARTARGVGRYAKERVGRPPSL
jgi:hypothetical protein